VKKPTILATVQAHVVRDMDASRRTALNAVKAAVWHSEECRVALAPQAVGEADIPAALRALSEIEKCIATAQKVLAIQGNILCEAREMVGAETPEQMETAEGRAAGTREANTTKIKRSGDNAAAIREEWKTTKGSLKGRCNAVRERFKKKAKAAARAGGVQDMVAERVAALSDDTILRAVGVRSK
jgi:hypothetical protein